MLNIANVFQNDADSAPAPVRAMFNAITTADLLDQSNPLPTGMASAVSDCTEHIQAHISEERKKAEDGDIVLLDTQIVAVRGGADIPGVKNKIDDLVIEWNRVSGKGYSGKELGWVRARIQDRLFGYDAIEPFMRDPEVTEILVSAAQPHPAKIVNENGEIITILDGGTRVEIKGKLVPAPGVVFGSDDDVLGLATQRLLPKTPPTVAQPIQSGMLANNTRVEVRHRDIGCGNTFISLRRHPLSAWTMKKLIDAGTISAELAIDLATWKKDRYNEMIAGGTGSGKTSTLNALIGFIDPQHHLIIIEDTPELNPPPFVFTSRAVTRRGRGEMEAVDQNDLMRSALRSRPEILAIGEARGGELVEILKAQSTGHHGSFSSLHADSAADSVVRMKGMLRETGEGAAGGLDHKIASAIDLIIFQKKLDNGLRRITSVLEIIKPEQNSVKEITEIQVRQLWTYDVETDTHIKLADISDELRTIRGVPANRAVVTMEEIETIHLLSQH